MERWWVMTEELTRLVGTVTLCRHLPCYPGAKNMAVRPEKPIVGKPTREGQLFLDDLKGIAVGTRIVKVFENDAEGVDDTELAFNNPGVSDDGIRFASGVRALHPLLSEAGVVPYSTGSWNSRNWLRLEKDSV
jgi:hypothetical protein